MSCIKVPGSPTAVGYWGRNIHRRIQAEQEHARQRALLTDQIKAGGLRAALWQSNVAGNKCACYKESNDQADGKCKTCYGTGYAPGYLKFGYTTVWMSVVDDDLTLTDCEVTTKFKSAKVMLSNGALTGTIESGDKAFSRTIVGSTWEYDAVSFIRIADDSSVSVEYSTDSGLNWAAISNLPIENPSSGVIRFRATLTRTATSIRSPLFEIVRGRFERLPYDDLQSNGTYRVGQWILILRDVPKSRYVKSNHGDTPARTELNFWTVGLSFFDSSIEFSTPAELIKSEDEGPCDFVEILDGAMVGARYVIIERSHSDPFGYIIVEQNFVSRVATDVGPYSLVW
jgi:hypothetical protein